MKIGTYTKELIRKAERKASRELELENQSGWVANRKVHHSKKNYSRKKKHKLSDF